MQIPAEQVETLMYAGWGFLGALAGAMSRGRRLELPRVMVERRAPPPGPDGAPGEPERVRVVDPGFLAAPILGALLAAMVDGRPWTAAAYGLAAGWAGPALLNALIDPLLERLLQGALRPGDAPASRLKEGGGA